ncbi:hypothetical protein QNI16_10470 [Cytophagaceae bacterium YF14B1]|uniref:DUF4488 domain-containing protein n=1 Tax=Xanthocytophaga flava TaxID=3048013 RepID=A0AAE3QLK6_9BACT|nr:hypothetical protein [Xanthocytophaga flavus]MDJ1480906.1 hypothetical protein [Xanthocytophaga flavus]
MMPSRYQILKKVSLFLFLLSGGVSQTLVAQSPILEYACQRADLIIQAKVIDVRYTGSWQLGTYSYRADLLILNQYKNKISLDTIGIDITTFYNVQDTTEKQDDYEQVTLKEGKEYIFFLKCKDVQALKYKEYHPLSFTLLDSVFSFIEFDKYKEKRVKQLL